MGGSTGTRQQQTSGRVQTVEDGSYNQTMEMTTPRTCWTRSRRTLRGSSRRGPAITTTGQDCNAERTHAT
eukprot:7660093-Pyramimonas_sp.AAC.1